MTTANIKWRIAQLEADDTEDSLKNWIQQLFAVVLEETKDKDMVKNQFDIASSAMDEELIGLSGLEEYEQSRECRLQKFLASCSIRAKTFFNQIEKLKADLTYDISYNNDQLALHREFLKRYEDKLEEEHNEDSPLSVY